MEIGLSLSPFDVLVTELKCDSRGGVSFVRGDEFNAKALYPLSTEIHFQPVSCGRKMYRTDSFVRRCDRGTKKAQQKE